MTMSSSASTFIGGLSIGAVGTLVVQQVASTPAPEPPVLPNPVLEVVPLLTLGLVAVAVYGGIVHGPRP
jgi:hypothetical protein